MTPGGTTPGGSTPSGFTPGGQTPAGFTPSGTTPIGAKAMAMATPSPGQLMSMTPEQLQAYTWQREIDERNRPLTDDELDSILPPGYKVLY
jgi:splicing factor 3B subunit 1